MDDGRMAEEILPVQVPQKKGETLTFERDERPRRDTTPESLSKLKPAFRQGGSVTAGNSSGMNDGAEDILLMRDEKATALGLHPMVRILSSAAAGVEPRVMGIGPVTAAQKALKRAGLTTADLKLVELNEAFAVQSLAVLLDLAALSAQARATPDLIYDQMVAAGCAQKVIFSYMGNPGVGSLRCLRAEIEAGRLAWEEYSHFGMISRLQAGAAGVPFMPMNPTAAGDLERANLQYRTVTDPYSGKYIELTPDKIFGSAGSA